MHITETMIRNTIYCYAAECNWNTREKKYDKPSKAVGKLDGVGGFVPNKYLSSLLVRESKDPSGLGDLERRTIETVKDKYGQGIEPKTPPKNSTTKITDAIKTATIIYYGPWLVFGSITSRYKMDAMLQDAFGKDLAQDILSLAWYITSEGGALSNNDSWLDYFENPRGSGFSSQEVSKLLDQVNYDSIMTFYKQWLKGFTSSEKILYDLT